MLAWRFLEGLRDINKITISLYSMAGKQHFGTMLMDGVPFSMSAEIMKLSKCINMIIIIMTMDPYFLIYVNLICRCFALYFDYMYLHRYLKKTLQQSQLGLL